MSPQRCGLCGCRAEDWDAHVAGDEHQAALADPEQISAAARESSSDTVAALTTLYHLGDAHAQGQDDRH